MKKIIILFTFIVCVLNFLYSQSQSATNQVIVASTNIVPDNGRGFDFTPNVTIYLDSIGKRVPGGSTYAWKIWQVNTQTLIHSQVSTATTPGVYTYEQISTPVTLLAGVRYTITLYGGADAEYYYDPSTQINPNLTYHTMRYCNSCFATQPFPTDLLANYHYGTPDFKFSTCNTAPTITCPANIAVNNDAGNCSAIVNYTTPTDPCATVITQTAGLPSGSAFPLGTTINTFQATNAFGSTTCSFTVTVTDNENPTITCPADVTINTDAGQCTSTAAIGTATGTDNCGSPTITNDAPASFPIGNTTVTWTSTDGAGNFVTCTQVVTVVDNENPTITCPSATTINTDAGQCTSTASIGTATGTDNCGTPTITNDAPASFPIGNTTVTWTSTDGAGNFVTCTQVVTVVDNEAPVITCPNDTVVGNTPGLCGSVVNYTAPVGTDNCTGASTVLISGLASGSTFPVGTTTVVYAVVDGNNNGDTCSFNVTVADSLAPTAVCQNITIYLDNTGNASILAADVDGGSSDDCVIDTLTLSQYNFTCSAIGTNNVTLYVTDTYGNIDSCTAIVTVMDTVVPTVMCQNINVYVDNAGNVSITPNDIDGGSSDMCGISAITASQTTFTCAELGLNNITLYVEDNNGNIDSCVAQVTVYDTIAPTITCPTNQEVSTDNTCM